jgi:hypothetical protein
MKAPNRFFERNSRYHTGHGFCMMIASDLYRLHRRSLAFCSAPALHYTKLNGDDAMNWFDNVSSDSDQPIAPARLMEGHWRHRLHPLADPVLCRVVMDTLEPRVVAAQVIEHGIPEDLGSSVLEQLTHALVTLEVHHQPLAWGLNSCDLLPAWARPTFSERQIEELERIEGYLVEAPDDDSVDEVLKLRDAFLKGIGMTERHVCKAVRQPHYGQVGGKGTRVIN